MPVVKNLMIRSGADFSGMRKEFQKAQKNLQDFKSNVSTAMKGIAVALAGLGMGSAIKDAAKSAMEVEAAMGQINRMMGASAQEFTNWAKNGANAFGLAKSEALKYGAVYANLISNFTKNTAETSEYTQDLLKTSAIVASATGRSMQDTMDRIRSGMLGETDAIEDLGININQSMIKSTEAFRKFAGSKSWDQLAFQTQQQIIYFAILEQATKKYGNAIADNTMSRQQAFITQLKNAQLAFGQFVLPIYNTILPGLTAMASALSRVMSVMAQFSQALFGKAKTQAKDTQQQAAAVTGLGDAYSEAGKAAKGAVSGFDELNLVGDKATDAGGAAALAGAANPTGIMSGGVAEATEESSTKVQAAAARVKAAFAKMSESIRESINQAKDSYGEFSNFVKEHSDIIVAAIAGVGAGFATAFAIAKWGAITSTMTKIIAGIRAAFIALGVAIGGISWPIVAIVAAVALLVGAFVYFYRTNEQFRDTVHTILQKIGEVAVWLWQNVLVPFGKWLADVMVVAWDLVSKAAVWLWKDVLVPLGDFLLWLWDNVLVPVGKIIGEVLVIAFETVAKVAKSFWENVIVPLAKAISESLSPAVEALSAVFTFLWQKVLQPLFSRLSQETKQVLVPLTAAFEFLWKNVLKPLAEFVGGFFVDRFDTLFRSIKTYISGLKDMFIGLMNFITGVFTGDWEKAWEGVKDIFKGVFESLWAVVKLPLNMIIDGINALIGGLNKFNIDIPDWVAKIAGVSGGKFGINIPKIPSLDVGTNFVARDGLAFLHEGEAVVPKEYNPAAGGMGDNREVVSVLNSILQAIRSSKGDLILMVGSTELGRVAANGINDIARRTGVSPLRI